MYAVGDYIVHPGQGVCRVEEITAEPAASYQLLPVAQRHPMRISFPVASEDRLRPVLSRDEATRIIKEHRDELVMIAEALIANETLTAEEIDQVLSGELVIRDGNLVSANAPEKAAPAEPAEAAVEETVKETPAEPAAPAEPKVTGRGTGHRARKAPVEKAAEDEEKVIDLNDQDK